MNWFESIIYGLISGITEFLPLSSFAHQQMYLSLCGEAYRDPVRDLFVHIALLVAIVISCQPMLEHIRRSRGVSSQRAGANSRIMQDRRFVKSATIPMLIVFFVLSYIVGTTLNLLLIAFVLILNGILLFIPDRIIRSNKDASTMSPFDSIIIGIAGALSAIPGFSRIGCNVSVATMRGADKQHALKWALLLSIPALWGHIIIDLIWLFSGNGVSQWGHLFYYFMAAASAFGASYCGIKFMLFLSVKQNYNLFSYYSWGASLIAFFLYLTVV